MAALAGVQRQRARLAQGDAGPGSRGHKLMTPLTFAPFLLTLGCGGQEGSVVARPIQGLGRQGYALAAFTLRVPFTLYF